MTQWYTFFDSLEDDPCRFHNLTIVMMRSHNSIWHRSLTSYFAESKCVPGLQLFSAFSWAQQRRQIGSWQKHGEAARNYDKLVHQLKYIYTSCGPPALAANRLCSDGRNCKVELILT